MDKLEYRVIGLKRISRTVQGGRKMRFSLIVVVGNKNGKYGFAMAKSSDTVSAIKKAYHIASKKMKTIFFDKNNFSIESQVVGSFNQTKIFLYPAKIGTGIVVGGDAARSVFKLAGIKNIIAKIHGSTTPKNVLEAINNAVEQLNTRHLIKEIKKNETTSVKTN